MPLQFEKYLSPARHLAREAGLLLASGSSKSRQMEFKGKFDPVTVMDRQSEKLITEGLKKTFPNHGILAEEGTRINSSEKFQWIIDPLDGTTNYAHALPFFSVSIALTQEGRPILGVVYAPMFDEEYTAIEGGGAFLNGRPIQVSRESDISRCFLATGEPYAIRENLDYHIHLFKKCIQASLGVRRFGSACLDLCNVASGNYDGYWEAELKPWDAAAGILIVQEAGGRVTEYQGFPYLLQKSKTLLATNGSLHEKMVGLLSS